MKKLTIYCLLQRLISWASITFFVSFGAEACGPFPPIIPIPIFFASSSVNGVGTESSINENLQLWQKLTSVNIPLKEIEEVVYKDSKEKFREMTDMYRNVKTNNIFYIYLRNTNDEEIINFLTIAKELEYLRASINSPWYYPSSRYKIDSEEAFQYIIDKCSAYKGKRLKDRYRLQGVRALFATRQYDKCIVYFNNAFKDIPDSNLFKRMSMKYVAGCWARLGEVDKANDYFAKVDDIYSLKVDNPVTFMASYNPDSPSLLAYIQTLASDSTKFCAIRPIAENVLSRRDVKHRGDWEFALAYIYGEFQSDYRKASKFIHWAIKHQFSSESLRDHAHAYRIKVDAENGIYSSLSTDLKWFETKINLFSPDMRDWNRMMQNIIYVNLVPMLWDKKDYTTAILLCSYADNLLHSKQYHAHSYFWWTGWEGKYPTIHDMRNDEHYWNKYDYKSLSFQLMGSLTSDQLIKVKHGMESDNSLYRLLKRYARHDDDYFNELIGTLALREGNYRRAVNYFAIVPDAYIRTMNVHKDSYLALDPFYGYYELGWSKNETGKWQTKTSRRKQWEHPLKAKLAFAKRMLQYQNQMKYGKTADIRGMARLNYAIGRRNSFEECWALTQYWRGEYVGLFEPALDYWSDGDAYIKKYDEILYDYEKTVGHEKTEKFYQDEIKAALAMLQSDEAKAEAEYMLGHLATIVRLYGNTAIGHRIKTSCDNWHSWL